MPGPEFSDRQGIHEEMDRARTTFHRLLGDASTTELRRHTLGTRWTNEQLLFHMLFGYMIVRALLVLVKTFGRLPDAASKVFARLLDSAERPFHVINFWGSRGGARVFDATRMGRKFDRVIASLHRHLDAESEQTLGRRMHFPSSWDPFFNDSMSLAEVYHYASQHFDFHREQLTLDQNR